MKLIKKKIINKTLAFLEQHIKLNCSVNIDIKVEELDQEHAIYNYELTGTTRDNSKVKK